MTTTLDRLDASVAERLARRDPALAQLPKALSAAKPGWRLHDVQWSPGQGCRLAFQVSTDSDPVTFVGMDLYPGGWSPYDYRSDPGLPGLLGAADPADVLDDLGQVVAEPIRHCRVEPVRYRPGARCVLRYQVCTTSGTARYYAKVFPQSVFSDVAERALRVAAAAGPGLGVVRTLAVWPARHTTVGVAAAGRSASAVLQDATVSLPHRADLAQRLGRLLADFHGLAVGSLPAHTATDYLGSVAELGPAVRTMDPALGDRLDALTDDLARQLPPEVEVVAVHGSFRPGQVVVDPTGRLCLLDLDGVGRGDAARDLGTALGQLAWSAIRQPKHAADVPRISSALLEGYRSAGRVIDAHSLAWWRAAALAQIAARRSRRLEVADWVLVPQLLDQAEHLLRFPQTAGAR